MSTTTATNGKLFDLTQAWASILNVFIKQGPLFIVILLVAVHFHLENKRLQQQIMDRNKEDREILINVVKQNNQVLLRIENYLIGKNI